MVMVVSFEGVKRMVGWCPDLNNYSIPHNNSRSSSSLIYNETSPPTLSPILLKNCYVAGLRKDTFVGLLFAFTFFVLYHISGYDSFFYRHAVELIMLSIVLTQFVISRSTVEIDSKYIRVSTILQRILGPTTYTSGSMNGVEVQKNERYTLAYWGLFIIGIFWLFLFLSQIFAGVPIEDLVLSLIGVVFCFGYGYIMYIGSKSVYHIRVRFNPHPSIYHLMIHTKDAYQIADRLEKVNRYSNDPGTGGAK